MDIPCPVPEAYLLRQVLGAHTLLCRWVLAYPRPFVFVSLTFGVRFGKKLGPSHLGFRGQRL